jgi:hypothetical protein
MFDFAALEPLSDFRRLCDPAAFTPLPEDWVLGLTDVVDSTAAVAAGRYKAVNMAGAAAIAAAMNALAGKSYPFSFGGDGALIAAPGDKAELLGEALAGTKRWAAEALSLELRAALVPVAAARKAGQEVAVARFMPSDAVGYAMFSGGGAQWAETEMKAGRHLLPDAETTALPDLQGLSCRWEPSPSRKGVILSMIVKKQPRASWQDFLTTTAAILARIGELEREGHPLPVEGASFAWPPKGLALEAMAKGRKGRLARKAGLALFTLFAWFLFRTGLRFGRFDPEVYRRYTVLNSDYRKFEDSLRMTLDCSPQTKREIEALLADARRKGILSYGLHSQDAAIMTCIVPSALSNEHFHFLDGIDGGYTAAARRLEDNGG